MAAAKGPDEEWFLWRAYGEDEDSTKDIVRRDIDARRCCLIARKNMHLNYRGSYDRLAKLYR